MAEQETVAGTSRVAFVARDDDGTLSREFVRTVVDALETGNIEEVRDLAGDSHFADVADLLEALPAELRGSFVQALGDDFDFAVLVEVDEGIRDELLAALPAETVAEGVSELDSDDAASVLQDLEPRERAEILEQMAPADRVALARNFDYPEQSAGRRMQSSFIAVPEFWIVGQTIDYMREADDLPDEFHEVFIVDPTYRLLGVVRLNRMLRAQRSTPMIDLKDETLHLVHAIDDQEEVARRFERYDLVSAAVVDENDRLVGVLTVDDMLDVIEDEAEEDIKRLAGLGDAELTDSVLRSSRSRLPWLVINALTAFIAAGVIGFFGGSIEEMVALAVLMPIVAALGGNTGVQAMTVTVRAIATRDLGRGNSRRIIWREMLVGLLNGIAIALLVGLGAGFWFANVELGVVIGLALVLNMFVAGLAGVLIPLTLNKFDFDPAVASGVFVSTVTDVVGFFAFLGLAALWFGLL